MPAAASVERTSPPEVGTATGPPVGDRHSSAVRWGLAASAATSCLALPLLGRGVGPGPAALVLLPGYSALLCLLVLERRRPLLRVGPVLALSVVLLVPAVALPPAASDDVWAYAALGRIAAAGDSPYANAPADLGDDPVAARVDPLWRASPSVYGPVFTALSAAVMTAAGTGALAARLAFQGLAALAVAAGLVLLARRTRDAAAVALVGLNPLVVVALVNGGHNDALVAVGILGGVLLAERGRAAWAGTVLGLAAAVKLVALLPLAAVVVWTLRRSGMSRAVATGAAAAALLVGSHAAIGGTAALRPLQDVGRRLVSPASPWNELRTRLGAPEHAPAPATDRTVTALGALTVAGAAVLVNARRRRHDTSPALAAGCTLLAFTLLAPYVLDWYPAWGLLALALCWQSLPAVLAATQGALLHLAYVLIPRDPSGLLESLQKTLRSDVLPVLQTVAAAVLLAACLRPGPSRAGAGDPATPTRWFRAASR